MGYIYRYLVYVFNDDESFGVAVYANLLFNLEALREVPRPEKRWNSLNDLGHLVWITCPDYGSHLLGQCLRSGSSDSVASECSFALENSIFR